jgi:hypothetical protein
MTCTFTEAINQLNVAIQKQERELTRFRVGHYIILYNYLIFILYHLIDNI